MTYGGTREAERLRAFLALPEPAWEQPPLLPSPTFHMEWEPLPDGTVIEWPVLDGPLPVAIGNWDDDEDYDRDR